MAAMTSSTLLARHGHRLIELGVALFLFTSLWGFVVHNVAAPRLGLSVHTLSAFEGVLLLGLGLVWPRLKFGSVSSRIAFWLLVYSALATLLPYVLAAIWGAGNETISLAAGSAHGTAGQEAIIRYVIYTAAPTGIIAFTLILWGLRLPRTGSLE
jgi:hydroxylaminobenzene mutase